MPDFQFTADWFTAHIPKWEKHLLHLAGTPCRCLEIGTYEGRSACWIIENLLGHSNSWLICVDPIGGDVKQRWHRNIACCKNDSTRVIFQNVEASKFFGLAIAKFDFIYIDGDHHGSSVITDACNSWKLLKSGGILIFDDYLWTDAKYQPHELPGPAIDYFMSLYAGKFDLLDKGYQVILRKR